MPSPRAHPPSRAQPAYMIYTPRNSSCLFPVVPLLTEHHARAVGLEQKWHLAIRVERIAQIILIGTPAIHHQKPAAARAGYLAAERAAATRGIVHAVDLAVAHTICELLFQLPVAMHHLADR